MSPHPNHHDHDTTQYSDKALLWSIIVNLGLSVFEFLAGLIAGSVALMADATHNTNDAVALIIAYVARKIARRGANEKFTFGYRRAELIGAMIQLTSLVIVGLFLVYESASRLISPEPISGLWVMIASCIALVVDVLTAYLLWSMSKGSLNVKAAFLHNLTDAAASVAVLIGGAAIYFFKWMWVDPIITLIIAGYILYMSFGLLQRTASILMEGTPPDIDLQELKSVLLDIDNVDDVHHIHIWELDEQHRAFEAHVVLNNVNFPIMLERKKHIKEKLREQFNIIHSTLEMETHSEKCPKHCSLD